MSGKMSSEEMFEKYEDVFRAQVELEEEMYRILETAENREEAEKQVMRGIVHDINTARGKANRAWKEYSDALKAEHEAEEAELVKLRENAGLDD